MNSLDFVYWLQGFFELSGEKVLDEQQVALVKQHIALVLTPSSKEVVGYGALNANPVPGATGVC